MSFFGKKKDVNHKAILERKLYLAQVDPEPVFDLAECDLKAVPSGTFSLCKVLRKELLYLQCNHLIRLQEGGRLSDLAFLRVLNLHSNKLTSLTDDIKFLKNLRELNISRNQLKVLPDGIGELSCLRLLDVSLNRLRCLPPSFGKLRQLEVLCVQGNDQLTKLPTLMGRLAGGLSVFSVDVRNFVYPPPEVCSKGSRAIIEYLAKECDELYGKDESADDVVLSGSSEEGSGEQHLCEIERRGSEIQEKVSNFAKEKEMRMKELAAIEKDIQDQQVKEFKVHKRREQEKNRLLEDLVLQENSLQSRLVKFQEQKDVERKQVIKRFQKVEEQSERLLGELLAANRKMMDPAVLAERDRIQREEMLSMQTLQLRRKEVLDAMEKLLAEELEQAARMINYELSKDEDTKDKVNRMEELQNEIDEMAKKRDIDSRTISWLQELQDNCGKKGTALGLLLERTDTHAQALVAEIVLAEQQLAALTSAELQRSRVDSDQLLSELGKQRIGLSELLVDLLEQRDRRRRQLLNTLVAVQENRNKTLDEDFWLLQYQRLMDRCPQGLEKLPDPFFVHCLVQFDAYHCLPYLVDYSPDKLDEITLEKIGVSANDQEAILYAVKLYKEQGRAGEEGHYSPSAPTLSFEFEPSAPPLPSVSTADEMDPLDDCTVCIVCMERRYEVVFIPCGHLCVCVNCASPLQTCPLCRSKLTQKIRVIVP